MLDTSGPEMYILGMGRAERAQKRITDWFWITAMVLCFTLSGRNRRKTPRG